MGRDAEVAVFVARRRRTEVLALRRSAIQGGYWHTVAGGIEAGEQPDDAARRELAEETGLRVEAIGEPFLVAYPLSQEPPERMHLYAEGLTEMPVHSYLVDAPDDWEPELDWEHDAFRWVAVEDAAKEYRWPETGKSLRALLDAP